MSTSGNVEAQDKTDEAPPQKKTEPAEEAKSDYSKADVTSTSGNAEAQDTTDEEPPPKKTEEVANLKGGEVDASSEKGENDKDENPQSGGSLSPETATTESAEAVDAAPTAEVESVEAVRASRRSRAQSRPWR
jgi:hypothetical protein